MFITVYSENAVQLIGGVTDNEGRLQVYKFGRWRSVCFNELDDKLSAVVCRSLDLPWWGLMKNKSDICNITTKYNFIYIFFKSYQLKIWLENPADFHYDTLCFEIFRNTSMVFANEPFIDGAYKLRILCNGSERSVDECKKQRYICQSEVFIFCLPPKGKSLHSHFFWHCLLFWDKRIPYYTYTVLRRACIMTF